MDVSSLLKILLFSGSSSPPPCFSLKSSRSCSQPGTTLQGRRAARRQVEDHSPRPALPSPRAAVGQLPASRVGGRSTYSVLLPHGTKLAACFPSVGQQMAGSSQKCGEGPGLDPLRATVDPLVRGQEPEPVSTWSSGPHSTSPHSSSSSGRVLSLPSTLESPRVLKIS